MENFRHRHHRDSFFSALYGLLTAFRTQPNFKIMFLAIFCVINAGIILRISSSEWLFMIVGTGLVFISEMINTSVESIVDLVTEEWRQNAKIAKDIGGGMVLLAVIIASIIGIFIFLPKLLVLFNFSNF